MSTPAIQEDWNVLIKFLPELWTDKAVELGALVRKRKIDSPQTLLRILFIYLADGKSLRSTVSYAKSANICDINDVALLYRLRVSKKWFRWIAIELTKALHGTLLPDRLKNKYRVRLVDTSSISQPGSKGTNWRLHYCFQLNSLICDTFSITDAHTGESFKQFQVFPGDLMIGDRGYCRRKEIVYILDNQGQVMVRFHSTNLPLFRKDGKVFAVLDSLRSLGTENTGDWEVWFKNPNNNKLIKARLCALKKSQQAADLAKKKLKKMASKKGRKLLPETLEYAEYVIIFTTVSRNYFNGEDILSLYRGRWQIELIFKRLKSIIGIGHLPSKDAESCMSWLYGKMVIALLMERLYREAELISPWGCPLRSPSPSRKGAENS